MVAKAHIGSADFVRAEIPLFGGFFDVLDQLFSLAFLTGDGMDMGSQRQDRRAVVQSRGFLQIADRLLKPTLLRVRNALERKAESEIGLQLETSSSELNRLVVSPREQEKRRSVGVGSQGQRIELDRAPDLQHSLVVPSLGAQIGRVVQPGCREARIELDGAMKFSLSGRPIPIVNEMNVPQRGMAVGE